MKNLLTTLLMLFGLLAVAQSDVKLTFSDPIPAGKANEFFIECSVENFIDISRVTIEYKWEHLTEFLGVDQIAFSSLNRSNFRETRTASVMHWKIGSGKSESLTDGSTLFRLRVRSNQIEKPCFFKWEIRNVNNNSLNLDNDGTCPVNHVNLYQLCEVENDTFNFDIVVDGFDAIAGFQLPIVWDSMELEFLDDLFTSPDIVDLRYNLNKPGVISVTWNDPGGQTVSVPRFTRIIRFRFLIKNPIVNGVEIKPGRLPAEFYDFTLSKVPLTKHQCGDINLGRLKGQIILMDQLCSNPIDTPILSGHTIQFENIRTREKYYSFFTQNGLYNSLLPFGEYKIQPLSISPVIELCNPGQTVELDLLTSNQFLDIEFRALIDCPVMKVNASRSFLRRCFDNSYSIEYQNIGTTTAFDAYIDITFDPYMSYVSSNMLAQKLTDRQYRVELGDVPAFSQGRFSFTVNIDCDSTILGQTHCLEAHIYPDSLCEPPLALWNGASIQAQAECREDSVHFLVKNVGVAASSELPFIIVEDDIGFMKSKIELAPQDSAVFSFESTGQTWRILMEQEPNHPGLSKPTIAVEGCNADQGEFSIGYFTQFSEDDENLYIDIDCQQSVGSYDPNDKAGYPLGVGDRRGIEPDQKLTYMIRFQNTGTDTAFNIVISDTISDLLDISSFEFISSSHDVHLDWKEGNLIDFYFSDILMPDSNRNEPESHGFVKYSINPSQNIQRGDKIHNKADIYFDFNPPIRTNTTEHLISPLVITSVDPENEFQLQMDVYPNPASSKVRISTPNHLIQDVIVLNGNGQMMVSQNRLSNQYVDVNPRGWSQGVYLVKVRLSNHQTVVGKLVVIP